MTYAKSNTRKIASDDVQVHYKNQGVHAYRWVPQKQPMEAKLRPLHPFPLFASVFLQPTK